jgi:glucose-1-phosphate thymidylyltransferase
VTVRLLGIVPAAGYATRMQPLAGSKELLRVRGRPVMDYLLERMTAAGCKEIRIVTRPEKNDVIAYARDRRLEIITGHPGSVSESLSLGLAGVPHEAIVLLGFPDTIWQPIDGFTRLLATLDDSCDLVLGLFWFDEPERGDVVTLAEGRVAAVEVKPTAPSSNWIWGCAVVRRPALRRLTEHPEPGILFDALARAGRAAGVALSRSYIDIGTPAALKTYGQTDGAS